MVAALVLFSALANQTPVSFTGEDVFSSLVSKVKQNHWEQLPIGELMGKIGTELVGTPYVGRTLELDDKVEYCTINLKGLDCVTFFESTFNLARIIKKGTPTQDAFLSAVRTTRYRSGNQTDYTSRLHYTTDWIFDNVKKGTVREVTPSLPGAEAFTQKVGYMSAHPEAYRQLKANSELVPAIAAQEAVINARPKTYLPINKIAAAEPLLQTGDIVGWTTTQEGIDIAHTGLLFRDSEGVIHFLDASSAKSKMKVTLEKRLSECPEGTKWTGLVVVRPLEP